MRGISDESEGSEISTISVTEPLNFLFSQFLFLASSQKSVWAKSETSGDCCAGLMLTAAQESPS